MGILSQGLRIAPPEAPSTGYMFGKGVYFADMVSKSANYCHAHTSNDTGLMMLCEVALGKMLKTEHAKYITKLKDGNTSCWGVGKNACDPKGTKVLENGSTIELGKQVRQEECSDKSSLLYNEFIVYDTKQVNIKYLLKLKFNYFD